MVDINVSPKLTVAGQPDANMIAKLARSRCAGVVNVRPDGEEGGQIGHEQAAAIAEKAWLSYAYAPVKSAASAEADIEACQRALAETEGPILDALPGSVW